MTQLSLHPDQRVSTGRFARVAVERGIDRLVDDGALVYAVPSGDVRPGDRVEVPLRGSRRPVGGIVVASGGVELLGDLSPERVRPIARIVGARLPEPLLALAKWMSDYYMCPLGMVAATMMPAAVKHSTGSRRRTGLQRAPEAAERLAEVKLTPSAQRAWEAFESLDPSDLPMEPRSLAAALGLPGVGPLNRLVAAGLLEHVDIEEVKARGSLPALAPRASTMPTPTPDQQACIDRITATLGDFCVHLIRGVTGSGKTEVYLRVIRRVLDAGKSSLVLVPEIALTPQTSQRFIDRFADAGVAVLHSGLSASERHLQWKRAAAGEARVVVGARSAVFAPLPNLGIIVVDEEHDSSYKQDQLPRYSARDVAVKRGQIEGATVVLGSATPSLESWANATGDLPRYVLSELTSRVGGATLPRVQIVNLAEQGRRNQGSWGQLTLSITPILRDALRHTLESNLQAILLLNRRGYASYVTCPSQTCGWRLMCSECDASMVLHRGNQFPKGQIVRCHHCLAEQLAPATCPTCRRKTISLGLGTQRVEEELVSEFGLESGRTLIRVDSDTMGSARDYFDALDRFARGEARVLMGTQMIAKGLDFPNVALVGVINADTALNLPDFRSTERTFQLVSQVAGRAGRAEAPGLVIVQTMNPESDAIRFASTHDYAAFARAELTLRRAASLPPAARMARIVIRNKVEDKAQAEAEKLDRALRDQARALNSPVRILGPMPCPITRIAGHFRFAIELIASGTAPLRAVMGALRKRGLLVSDARTAIDVDPLVLL